MVECSVLKELKLMYAKVLRRKAVCNKVTQFDAAQHASIASFQRRAEYYEGQRDTGKKRDKAGNSGSDGGLGSSGEPEGKCSKKQ